MRSRSVRYLRQFMSARGAVLAAPLVAVSLVVAFFGVWLAPENPNAVHLGQAFASPSAQHWFGTDNVGRDMFSRVLAGGRYTVLLAIILVLVSLAIGGALGAIGGYAGGVFGASIARLTDLFLGYPALLLAVAIAAALGPGLIQTALAIVCVMWSSYARLMQVQCVGLRDRDFVNAAKVAGVPFARRLFRHVVPNALSPILVKVAMDIALCVEWIASLGFVGLGAQPPTPEWGSMIASSESYATLAWWLVVFPCCGLLVVTLGFNLLGDALDSLLVGDVRVSRRALRALQTIPSADSMAAASLEDARVGIGS